jgi:hypothetical protein
MLLRHSRLIAAATALLLSLASAAGADVLWDQSNLMPPPYDGALDESANSCSQISGNTKIHIASDVHFDYPVHITTIRIYETPGNVQAATLAYLWIAPKTGPIPTVSSDQLEPGPPAIQVPITPVTVGPNGPAQFVRVSATGLDIELPAGDYWVSLTPRHNLGILPYTFHIIASGPVIGDPAPSIVACTVNSDWVYSHPSHPDYAMKIEGEVHRPTAAMPTGLRDEVPGP